MDSFIIKCKNISFKANVLFKRTIWSSYKKFV